jgi:dynein intermediate chain 1
MMRKKTTKNKPLKSSLKRSSKGTKKQSSTPTSKIPPRGTPKRKLNKLENGQGAQQQKSKAKELKQNQVTQHQQQQQQQQQEEDDLYKEPIKRIIRPDNQLVLTEIELNADISRILTGDDPNVPKNISKFSFKEKCFKLDPPGLSDHMAIHLVLDGCSLHIESKGYKEQKEMEERKREAEEENRKALEQQQQQQQQPSTQQQGGSNDQGSGSGGGEGTSGGGDKDTAIDVSTILTSSVVDKSKNQFNFSDRATQTLNNKLRSRFVCTEPPPVAQYNENVSQWQIYDSYINELMVTNMEHSDEQDIAIETSDDQMENHDAINGENMSSTLKTIERLVNQNAQDEIYNDFKYWEDASDQFRKGEGSFLPLWRFAYERTKRKQVTALCWNPGSPDLFAVGYGSYDFLQQSSGMICCYTLKNTSYPEYIYSTESGVLCLDFHPQHPSLLAVGCYDGNVAVYNVSKNVNQPLYSSSIQTGLHSDPVWQVNWQKEEIGKNLNFYSISSDGAVVNWSLSKNELQMEPVIQLKLDTSLKDDQEESAITGLAGGCCFDFSHKQDHLFLVGTEEGNIHKCSKSYSGQYLQTYEGHHMAIYAVKWNPFHEETFISCSADWTIKVGNLLLHCAVNTSLFGLICSPSLPPCHP